MCGCALLLTYPVLSSVNQTSPLHKSISFGQRLTTRSPSRKQCRDENGFKCHLDSDSHKRQMMVFGEAPDRIIQGAAPRPARHPKHPLLFVATLAAPG